MTALSDNNTQTIRELAAAAPDGVTLTGLEYNLNELGPDITLTFATGAVTHSYTATLEPFSPAWETGTCQECENESEESGAAHDVIDAYLEEAELADVIAGLYEEVFARAAEMVDAQIAELLA